MNSYHDETIYQRGSLLGHSLDWGNRPLTVKSYKNKQLQPLHSPASNSAAFFDISGQWPPRMGRTTAAPPNAGMLSRVLGLSAGITSPRWEDGFFLGLRAPASAGALYPSELYVAACEVEGIEDGLYHYSPQGLAANQSEPSGGWHLLWPQKLAAMAAQALGGRAGRLSFFISSVLWRSLWKYNTRAYRYCLLDAGHMLANLELALAAFGMLPRTSVNFADDAVSVLLGLPDQDEIPLVAVRAGGAPEDPGPADIDLPPLDLQPQPLSRRIGRDYAVLEYHRASRFSNPRPEPVWEGPMMSTREHIALPKDKVSDSPGLEQVMQARRSRRGFSGRALSIQQLSLLLKSMLPGQAPVLALVVVGQHAQLASGTYLYLSGQHALLPRSQGQDWRGIVADACLSQGFMAKAGVQIILWADLYMLEKNIGARAYRHAMLAAGRAGQRCYLAAEALGLSCCGVGAFYDDDLSAINGMPERAQPLYVLAIG